MNRSIVLALLLGCGAWGVTLDQIADKPASRAKNFYIWQFLKQEINATEAKEAFYQVDGVNERFLVDYSKKSDEAEIRYTAECMARASNELMGIENDDCLYLALTPAKAETLTSYERELIASRISERFGGVDWLHSMNRENHFALYSDLADSLRLFLVATPTYRADHFNRPLDPQPLAELSALKGFGSLVYIAVNDPKLSLLSMSLASLGGGNYDHQTHFYLGINALRYGRSDNALLHLTQALKKGCTPMEIDKSLFWLYRTTQDGRYLDKLAQSLDINMYTQWAKERLGVEFGNYFSTLPTSRPGGERGDNPYAWQSIYQQVVSSNPETIVPLIERFSGEDSVAIQGFILERTYTPYIHNYTMPYDAYISGITNDQKAFLYALMRQETQLIPGLISRSFALGLMQIMPFNVDTITKIHPLKVASYDDMFDPAYNIPYAIEHLKHIEKSLFNPVFKAYAYNGGFGAAKRIITAQGAFGSGEHEPFMSMELIANTETREYGKRVLANYIIYKKIAGESASISAVLDTLTQPSLSDRLRGAVSATPL